MNASKVQIREFFGRFFRTSGLADAEDIFAGGYVNSLFAMQLIAWLESSFDLAIEDQDLKISNFNSIDSIAAFIASKTVAQEVA